MSEALRGWDQSSKTRISPDYVEPVAATSTFGHFFYSTSNVFLRSTGPCASSLRGRATRHNVFARDLHSLPQAICDIVFIVALGLSVGLLFTIGSSDGADVGHDTIGHFWNALTVAVVYSMLERLPTNGTGFGVTTRTSRFQDAAKVWTLAFAGLVFFHFALKTSSELSRGYLAAFYLSGVATFGFWRALAAPPIAKISKRFGVIASNSVVVGDVTRPEIKRFAEELEAGVGADTKRVVLNSACSEIEWPKELRRALDEVCRTLRSAKCGAVYLCSAGLTMHRLEVLCRSFSMLPAATYIVPSPETAGLVQCRAFSIGNRVVFELRRPPLSQAQMAAKRMVDLVFGALALIVLSPIMIAAAVAIRLDSKGPIFFRQARTGLDNRPFYIIKFRSMYVLENGPNIRQACRNDPRVTCVGRFLRASSIDELPQLFNVLKGEMSLVGPRPHALAHDEFYAKQIASYELRQFVKPGITGWAQVNGLRGETASVESMCRRVEFDIWYAVNASLLLDFEIMARTVFEVCRPRNAY